MNYVCKNFYHGTEQRSHNSAGVDYPIVQAPMLGITTPQMVAAVSNNGGLGSLPVGGLSPQKTRELIRQTKALTSRPFAVNLFANEIPAIDYAQVAAMQSFLAKLCAENGIPYTDVDVNDLRFYSYKEQMEVLVEEQIPIVSFTFGIIDKQSITTLKENNTRLIGTATCLKEAIILSDNGIDMITAQGIEAGGHRGTFLKDEPLPMVGLFSLVSQIVNHVDKPVLAAGGINDPKTIKAAFALGAKAVQVGTAFIGSDESLAIPSFKTALSTALDTDSVLTRAFSGRWARGLKNKMLAEIESSGLDIPAYPIHNSITAALRAAAQKQDNKEFTHLWAGQSAFKTTCKPSKDILLDLISVFSS